MSNKKNIEYCQALAKNNEGVCLDLIYKGIKFKYKWSCKFKHEFLMRADDVKEGHWCRRCGDDNRISLIRTRTFDECKNIIESKKGKCLIDNFINSKTKLLVKCQFGHQWETTSNSIQQGRWCTVCVQKNSFYHPNKNNEKECEKYLNLCKRLAIEKEGECLSKQYVNSQTKIHLKCKNNHEWSVKPNNFQRGQWCGVCSRLLNKSLPEKTIFDFVKNIYPDAQNRKVGLFKNKNLEADIYIPSLKTIIE